MTTGPRTVLVTGASRNIGAGIGRYFAERGDRVALTARSGDDLAVVRDQIAHGGGRALAVPGDLAEESEAARVAEHVTAELGDVDVLVNNAVARLHKPFVASTTAELSRVFDVTLWGTIRMSKAILPGMLERGWGRIVTVIGMGASRGAAGRVGLTAAKAAQAGLTRSLGLEVAGSGVTVNGVAPGMIRTERGHWTTAGDVDEGLRAYERRVAALPMGRMGEVAEVAAACWFLASAEASYVNGHVLDVNGGDFR